MTDKRFEPRSPRRRTSDGSQFGKIWMGIASDLRCFHRENFACEKSLRDAISLVTPPAQGENKFT
jgi:hypothetical protein